MKNVSRPKGRPAKALVTRKKIASAALQIVEHKGLEALSMSAVARSMKVSTAALYNHISNKEELLALVQDDIIAKVDTSSLKHALAGELPAADALRQWAWSYRDILADNIPLIRVITELPLYGSPQTISMYELLVQVIALAGVPETEVITRLVAVESLVFGSAYDVHAPLNIFESPGPGDSPLNKMNDIYLAQFRDQSSEESEQSRLRADKSFETGLEALLEKFLSSNDA